MNFFSNKSIDYFLIIMQNYILNFYHLNEEKKHKINIFFTIIMVFGIGVCLSNMHKFKFISFIFKLFILLCSQRVLMGAVSSSGSACRLSPSVSLSAIPTSTCTSSALNASLPSAAVHNKVLFHLYDLLV